MYKIKVTDFLINPRDLVGDLLTLIKKDINRQIKIKVWREESNIFVGSPEYFWDSWDLLIEITFFADDKLEFSQTEQRKNFTALKGRSHLGKFFFYPIWVDIFSRKVRISQQGKTVETFQLLPSHFLKFWKEFVNNPPQKEEDCFKEKISPLPHRFIYGKNIWLIK